MKSVTKPIAALLLLATAAIANAKDCTTAASRRAVFHIAEELDILSDLCKAVQIDSVFGHDSTTYRFDVICGDSSATQNHHLFDVDLDNKTCKEVGPKKP